MSQCEACHGTGYVTITINGVDSVLPCLLCNDTDAERLALTRLRDEQEAEDLVDEHLSD